MSALFTPRVSLAPSTVPGTQGASHEAWLIGTGPKDKEVRWCRGLGEPLGGQAHLLALFGRPQRPGTFFRCFPH